VSRWFRTGTGGGCTAERLNLPDGRYALLTDEYREAQAPTPETTAFVVGLYSAEDDYLGCETGTHSACMVWLARKIEGAS